MAINRYNLIQFIENKVTTALAGRAQVVLFGPQTMPVTSEEPAAVCIQMVGEAPLSAAQAGAYQDATVRALKVQLKTCLSDSSALSLCQRADELDRDIEQCLLGDDDTAPWQRVHLCQTDFTFAPQGDAMEATLLQAFDVVYRVEEEETPGVLPQEIYLGPKGGEHYLVAKADQEVI